MIDDMLFVSFCIMLLWQCVGGDDTSMIEDENPNFYFIPSDITTASCEGVKSRTPTIESTESEIRI